MTNAARTVDAQEEQKPKASSGTFSAHRADRAAPSSYVVYTPEDLRAMAMPSRVGHDADASRPPALVLVRLAAIALFAIVACYAVVSLATFVEQVLHT